MMPNPFTSPLLVFAAAILLRIGLFFYGLWQDANSPVKYTDIDYYVFTDAARAIAHGGSPYDRETYRYTPLLAWLLLPTTWSSTWFSFGKVIFATSDIVAGWLIFRVLRSRAGGGMATDRALRFASIWLLNPMVATISTRGSSEGLLGVMVVALLWAVLQGRIAIAGMLLGLGVHFKIYPFIYAFSIVWWLDDERLGEGRSSGQGAKSAKPTKLVRPPSSSMQTSSIMGKVMSFCNEGRLTLAVTSLATFLCLNIGMYAKYGWPFLQHTYLHHVTRSDHRHNFSPYNTLLYLNSALAPAPTNAPLSHTSQTPTLASLAFLPQLVLTTILLPLTLAKKDLPSTMLAQTFAFATFNKVCTSQYFLWYMVFLPFYLPKSSLLAKPRLGLAALGLWIVAQGLWLQQGYWLEFWGESTFFPGLWGASLLFFGVNVWILGVVVGDIGVMGKGTDRAPGDDVVRKVNKTVKAH